MSIKMANSKNVGLLVGLVLFLASELASSNQKRYDRYKLLNIRPDKESHIQLLRILETDIFLNSREVDFWDSARSVSRPILVSIGPSIWDKFHGYLKSLDISHNIVSDNLQSFLDNEKIRLNLNRLLETSSDYDDFSYNQYHNYDEIIDWILETKMHYPDLTDIIKVTESYEGRTIYAIKVSSQKNPKYAAYIQAGTHAREWVSPATALYFINQLLANYGKNELITSMLDTIEWYFVPLHNVDGYSYSWTEDRLWRKTRSPNNGSVCNGTDPNRNWPFEWGGMGASTDPCHEDYRGPSPLSEIEVEKVVELLEIISKNREIIFFLDIHSYSQLWLSPWSYTFDLPRDAEEQEALSEIVVEAITSVYGIEYISGPAAETIYVCSGTSIDWAYGSKNITHSYTIELRPGPNGSMGFLLPEEEIIPTATEAFEGLKAAAEFLIENYTT